MLQGTRFAVPCFFTTCPQPTAEMGASHARPADDATKARELWRTLFAPEEVSDFRQFTLQWHDLLAE